MNVVKLKNFQPCVGQHCETTATEILVELSDRERRTMAALATATNALAEDTYVIAPQFEN